MPRDSPASLADARGVSDAAVVLAGDWGGQVYVTCPVAMVHCDQAKLERLLADLDRRAWDSNDGEGASLRFERRPIGTAVPGGMGGGVVRDGVWVHEEFEKLGLADAIAAVVADRLEGLPSP